MRALKILVVVMGVMLVAGIGVLASIVVYRLGHREAPQSLPSTAASRPQPVPGATSSINIPPGAAILDMSAVGQNLVLRVKRLDGSEALLVVDIDTGVLVRTIELRAAP